MISRKTLGRVCGLLLLMSLFVGLTESGLDPAYEKGLQAIQWSSVYDYNRTLASDRFGGRFNADPAFREMMKWVETKFKEWNLNPISAGNGYFQHYPFPYTVVDRAEMTLFIPKGRPSGPQSGVGPPGEETEAIPEPSLEEVKLNPQTDFMPFLSSGTGDAVSAEIVFAGYGISAPDLGYDDYADLDVKGKFILCFSGTPESGEKFTAARRTVMNVAKEKGALGLLRISNPSGHPNSGNYIEGFLPAMITEDIADRLLKEKGVTAAELRQDLRLYKRPLSFPLASKISYTVESRHFPEADAYNIVGYIEGTDPALKNEVVLYGAHVDHMGRHMDILFPGADDNASGSAVVMQIAEAFSKMGRHPKRTVAFGLFSGEEYGILGSQYFAKNLPEPFHKIAVMINFDMVGEGDGARASCSPEPEELKASIEKANEVIDILGRDVRVSQPRRIGGTDHTAFAVILGCPTASFSSNGPHLGYHQPGDTIFRINPDILAEIAKVAYLAGAMFADR